MMVMEGGLMSNTTLPYKKERLWKVTENQSTAYNTQRLQSEPAEQIEEIVIYDGGNAEGWQQPTK